MIDGIVDNRLEATIVLSLELPDGRVASIDAVVDTGYNGQLTLPSYFLEEHHFPVITSHKVMLADGSIMEWPRYDATIWWHGMKTHVAILASEGEIFVGMALLQGGQLKIDVCQGGKVRIVPLSELAV